jgi:hypothetical protein
MSSSTESTKSVLPEVHASLEENESSSSNIEYMTCMVRCKWSIRTIVDFLHDRSDKLGPVRVMKDIYGKETPLSLVVIEKEIYDQLVIEGYGDRSSKDFSIYKYEIKPTNYPRDNYSSNFFIPILRDMDVDTVKAILENKLEYLVYLNILPVGCFKVSLPLKSREKDIPQGNSFVIFNDKVTTEQIILAKVILDDNFWYAQDLSIDSTARLKISWARERNQRKGAANTKNTKTRDTKIAKAKIPQGPYDAQDAKVLEYEKNKKSRKAVQKTVLPVAKVTKILKREETVPVVISNFYDIHEESEEEDICHTDTVCTPDGVCSTGSVCTTNTVCPPDQVCMPDGICSTDQVCMPDGICSTDSVSALSSTEQAPTRLCSMSRA